MIDRHQPLFVYYELTDAITGKNADRCLDWLDDRSVELTVDPHATTGKPEAGPSVDFYEEVVRTHPWIRVRAFPAAGRNPLQIQFKLQCSYQPTRFQWEFEGGVGSSAAEPVHTFTQPGTYRVTVTVNGPLGGKHRRAVSIKVPEVVLTIIGESRMPAEPARTPDSP
jgi:PKD repeat protein